MDRWTTPMILFCRHEDPEKDTERHRKGQKHLKRKGSKLEWRNHLWTAWNAVRWASTLSVLESVVRSAGFRPARGRRRRRNRRRFSTDEVALVLVLGRTTERAQPAKVAERQ